MQKKRLKVYLKALLINWDVKLDDYENLQKRIKNLEADLAKAEK